MENKINRAGQVGVAQIARIIQRRNIVNASEVGFTKVSRVEIPEIISAEQRCYRVLMFFRADSGNIKNICAISELISSAFF